MKCKNCRSTLKEVLDKHQAASGKTLYVCDNCGKKYKSNAELMIGVVIAGTIGYFLLGTLSSLVENEFVDKYLDLVFMFTLLCIIGYSLFNPKELKK